MNSDQLEANRLSELLSYQILDTDKEPSYDELAEMAKIICKVPIALITFLDDQRQWFKSCFGLNISETSKEVSFCQYTIREDKILEIKDALTHPLFKDNPLVTGKPYIRFYAGAPLITPAGYRLGSLCVIDRQPRQLSADQTKALTSLSNAVVNNLELKKKHMTVIKSATELNQLNHKLSQANHKLKKAKEEAEEAAAIKEQFLSTMSHEIRTPLNAVIGITQLLVMQNPLNEQKKNLSLLKFSADNLLALINDVLDYNKLESNKVKLEQVNFDLRALLKGVADTFSFKLEEKNLEFNLHIDNNAPQLVIGDPQKLNQVLTNLISNAVKFTHQGSITLAVNCGKDDFITFKVIDTGIGIADNKLDKIFKRFTQADEGINRQYGGTGLGLAISKKLVHLMKGHLSVSSVPDQGSCFEFEIHLPIGSTSAKLEVQEELLNFKSYDLKVLVIEDNEINQLVATNFLQMLGVKFDLASEGKKGLQKIMKKQYDLVLLDLQLPGMHGYEIAGQIRSKKDKYYQNLPLIALTATSSPGLRFEVVEKGMDDYLTKPLTIEVLQQTISKFLLEKVDSNS